MSIKYLELLPDRNLLDHNFDGYKLSLQSVNSTKCELDFPVDRTLVDPNQYSFLHAKIFGLHNFLLGETNEYENVYYIDQDQHVRKANFNSISNEVDIYKVWTIPAQESVNKPINSGNYNASLILISQTLAVLSDGKGSIFLLNTGDRSTDTEWKLVFTTVLLENKSFYIQDAVLKESELHLILCRIDQDNKKTKLAIYWFTFLNENDNWEQKSVRELSVQGDVSYLYLERSCDAIYVASTKGCKFIFDSEKLVENEEDAEKNYKWSQDSEDVVVHFILPEDITKEDMVVTSGSTNIKVEHKGNCLLDGALLHKVDSELTTVSRIKNLLEIHLIKEESGLTWTNLLKDKSGDITMSDEFCINREIQDKPTSFTSEKEEDPPQGITFNTEQVEECDFLNSDLIIFERLCVHSHKVTHKYNFGTNQVLLRVQTNQNLPPLLGIRHDVDVCLWKPQFHDDVFELKHVGTLLALGYIQASKQQKKFISCPPDLSYSLICETMRHMFLYRQKTKIKSGELRNRKSGSRVESVAQQQVICIPNEEILGLYVSSSAIYVLGENFLIHVKV